MTPTAFVLIVLAGLMHAGWHNVAELAAGDAPRFACFTAYLMMLVWAPLGWWLERAKLPRWRGGPGAGLTWS